MDRIPTLNEIQQMDEKELAELNRKMAKRALRNMLIVFGIKWAIIYLLKRWARSQAEKY